jgi:hypothetical protein
MAVTEVVVGQEVRITATFTNSAGTLTDPTTITIEYKKPDGTVVTGTYAGGQVIKSSTGIYYRDVTPAIGEEGEWLTYYAGTGTIDAAENGRFHVTAKVTAT